MRPFFFGSSQKPLFGIHHAPQSSLPRDEAVLLCYPFGQEYIRSHRSMRELGSRLAGQGFHGLRFDYYGCGDSAGAGEQASVDQWLSDIALAIEEIQLASGLSRVAVVGLRLGAALAALAATRCPEVSRLVLWDPVVAGAAYLDELTQTQNRRRRGRSLPAAPEEPPAQELLGFPLPAELRRGIERIDLSSLEGAPAGEVLVVTRCRDDSLAGLCDHLGRLASRVDFKEIPGPRFWSHQDGVAQAVVPHPTLECITGWLARGAA